MGQDHVVRAVATPGAAQKKKHVCFCQKLTEERYSKYLRRAVFIALKLWCYQQQQMLLRTLSLLADDINRYTSELVAFISDISEWENKIDE